MQIVILQINEINNMGKNTNLKNNIYLILILICPLIVSGCYSFREVSKEDYLKNERHNKTKFILNNKNELNIDKNNKTKISDDKEIIVINDTSQINVSISDINKIMEERFDIIKTILLQIRKKILI